MQFLFGELLNRGMSIILIPVYTAYLSTADYGIYGTLLALIAVTTVLGTLCLNVSVNYWYHHTEAEHDRRDIIWTIYWLQFWCLAAFHLLAAATLPLYKPQWFPEIPTATFLLALLTSFVSANFQVPASLFQSAEDPKRFLIITTANPVIAAILAIALLVFFGGGVDAVFISLSAAALFASVRGFTMMRAWGRGRFRPRRVLELVKFSLPLVPNSLLWWVTGFANRFLIQNMLTLQAAGLITLGSQFSNIATTLGTGLSFAWNPMMLRLSKQEDGKQKLKVLSLYVVTGFVLIGISVLFGARWLIAHIISKDYIQALDLLPMLVGASCLNLIATIPIGYIYAVGETRWVLKVSGATAIINVVANWILIRHWGVEGSALASLLSFVVCLVAATATAFRRNPIPADVPKLARLSLLAVAFFALAAFLPVSTMIADGLIAGGALAAFVLALFAARIIDWAHIQDLIRQFRPTKPTP